MNEPLNNTLMAYAAEKLANWAGKDATATLQNIKQRGTTELNIESYLALLQSQKPAQERGRELTSLLSLVTPPKDEKTKETTPKSLAARPLSLDAATPSGSDDNGKLWTGFTKELIRLPDNQWRFESFSHLFYRYAWAVPCTYGEAGVSLYEEFKALAALAYASNGSPKPAEQFLLVGGDISGIQNFIYTVSHKMAARGLRGRSFFLQLVSDAVVRAILHKLELPWTNVVYDAGGTFLILAPYNTTTENKLKDLCKDFDQTLLSATQGQLRVAIGWTQVGQHATGQPEAWRDSVKAMHEQRSKAKQQPFADAEWAKVFDLIDQGGERYCAICHRGLQPNEGEKLKTEEGKTEWACNLCYSFGDLANNIRHEKLWLVVQPESAAENQNNDWVGLLLRLSGHRYEFKHNRQDLSADAAMIYALNEPDFLKHQAYGFRLLANVTPRMTKKDEQWAKKEKEAGRIFYEDAPKEGHVRDLDVMARDGKGVNWLAVLRMDVDNLGAVFTQWGPGRALAGTSALSSAMNRFFSGNLNTIVREAATVEKDGEKRLAAYLIYAGGDDLFIVGTWDKMVELAEQIQLEFQKYTGNPNLTISAGISLLDRPKFPLALAAQQAKEALDDKAKAPRRELTAKNGNVHSQLNDSKNAICFLDTVVGWERWPAVKKLQKILADLADREKTPRSLIQLIRHIHAQYEKGRREYEDKQQRQGKSQTEIRNYPMFHGRWMWLAAYQLKRMEPRDDQEVKEKLRWIYNTILQPEVTPYCGLAARWAEYLSRKKEKNG